MLVSDFLEQMGMSRSQHTGRAVGRVLSCLRADTVVLRRKERVAFDKVSFELCAQHVFASSLTGALYQITARVNKLCFGLDPRHVDPIE